MALLVLPNEGLHNIGPTIITLEGGPLWIQEGGYVAWSILVRLVCGGRRLFGDN